jgi:hypothetical protein
MPNEHHPPATERHAPLRWVWIALAVVSACRLLFAALVSSGDTGTGEASQAEESPITPSPTTATVDPQKELEKELVSRLREILARREVAYRERNPNILKEIYAVDCPCLKSDTNAIREPISEKSV